MLALLLFKLCDYTSAIMLATNNIPPSTELLKSYDQQLLSSTQQPSSKIEDSLVNADLVHFTYKSNQLNDQKNVAIINRSKRNSKVVDRSFIRLGRLDTENNRQMNFNDRLPSKPGNNFIRFGRSEPSSSSIKNTGFIRFGRSNSNNKGYIRLGRNDDDRSDIMRFGRRGDKFIRFGRNDGGVGGKSNNHFNNDVADTDVTPETYAIRGENDDFFKILRPVPRIGRNDKFIRFGRRDKGFIRFGKKSIDDNKNLSKISDQSLNDNQSSETLKSETKEIIGDQITHPLHVLIDKSDLNNEEPAVKPFGMINNDKDYNNDHYYQTNLINEDSELFDDDNIDSI